MIAEGIDSTFSISNNGVLLYHKGGGAVGRQLTWFDRTGKTVGTVGEPAEYGGVERPRVIARPWTSPLRATGTSG